MTASDWSLQQNLVCRSKQAKCPFIALIIYPRDARPHLIVTPFAQRPAAAHLLHLIRAAPHAACARERDERMTDTKRNQPNQPNRGQQQGSQGSQDPQRQQDTSESQRTQASERDSESLRDDGMEPTRTEEPKRGTREPSSVAHDRGRSDSERRDFRSDREADELGSELERETGIETEDEEDIDRPGRNNR
jgi:hypothetical protein